MSDVVIKVENLYKEYRLGTISHGTLRQDLQSWWARMRGKEDPNSIISSSRSVNSHQSQNTDSGNPHMLALNDVSFEVKRGEVLGIIGRNGAGKSTLLKILSEVTTPTKGTVKIKGRVASLLEVGTGFHPELTGRENIYLNGTILGMKKAEIDRKFDEIVAFAEIEKFIDTPVKRYSSGMYVRLAFAVAAHLEPEILIVDEVLAVGDAQFQKKCLGKMGEVSKEGRTVLFVSHNMTAIKTLCNRSVLLDSGEIKMTGDANKVIECYLSSNIGSTLKRKWNMAADAPGTIDIKLVEAELICKDDPITVNSQISLLFNAYVQKDSLHLNFSLVLYDINNVFVFNSFTGSRQVSKGYIQGECIIPPHLLNDEQYSVRILIVRDSAVPIIDLTDVLTFEVKDSERDGLWYGKIQGVVRPELQWEIRTFETIN